MGLLEKLKSAIGLDGSGSNAAESTQDVDVTVEHEPQPASGPATESEDAVKGTGEFEPDTTSSSGDETGPATETEADADDRSESEADAEAETTQQESDVEAASDDAVENAGAPVEDIKGIGPSYGERLAEAGVVTIGDLAGADAETIADETELSEKRISRWIDRARGEE